MGYKTIEIGCKSCEHIFDFLQHHTDPEEWQCPECQSKDCVKRISMPKILTSDSASFLDGTKRPGFAEAKLASSLKSEMLDMPVGDRAKIKKEIKKLGIKNDL